MKKYILLFLTLCMLSILPPVSAQTNVTTPPLEFISIELWPDYDQKALLVLISGVLPAESERPATISLPLPPEATVNAVAQVDETHGGLLNLDYVVEGNTLTFTTPSEGFRVEYYQPYTPTGTERNIRFAWTPTAPVDQVVVSVQEPLAAADFTLSPTAEQIQQLDTGLRYHLFSPQTLTAGQPLFLEISYDLPTEELSQPLAQANAPQSASPASDATDTAVSPAIPNTQDGFFVPDWVLFASAFALLLVAGFFFVSAWRDRQKKAGPPAKPKRQKAKGKHCPTCGTAVDKNGKFCRQCGTPL